ncbi:MAG: class I SAM-dependent methyltransferase, partial [Thermodesulfovibrionales bacterium]|nr:class I SAM-dependent methyltransferase [Thermodesulfovibrionales bacterium]
MKIDYHSITESPGMKASDEQLSRLYHRYRFASDYASNKDVLEVACGSGIGLGYLATTARHVVGGDIDEKNVGIASNLYKGDKNIDIISLDAHHLNYPDVSFDIVLLYEAIYYLQTPQKAVSEAFRVLKQGGALIICTVNKNWEDFHPS